MLLLALGDTLQPNREQKGEGCCKELGTCRGIFQRAASRGTGSAVAHIFNGVLTWRALVSSSVPQRIYSLNPSKFQTGPRGPLQMLNRNGTTPRPSLFPLTKHCYTTIPFHLHSSCQREGYKDLYKGPRPVTSRAEVQPQASSLQVQRWLNGLAWAWGLARYGYAPLSSLINISNFA